MNRIINTQHDLSKIWVIEYSLIQSCFHYDTLDVLMEANRRAIERGLQPQYVPIAVAQSADECVSMIKEVKARMGKR